jgi:hypothetical protein
MAHEGAQEEVGQLVAELVSLRSEPAEAIAKLAPRKKAAIKLLKQALLEGELEGVYQVRQNMVYALSKLGAKGVLVQYLRHPRETTNPVLKFAEEAVESTAAHELGQWKDDRTFNFLLRYTKTRLRNGGLEALGESGRQKARPVLEAALADDFYGPTAKRALEKLDRSL